MFHTFVQEFYQWCYYSNDYAFIRQSPFALPMLEVLHMVGIVLLLGTTFALDMRLMELGFNNSSLPSLAKDLWGWSKAGLVLASGTGVLIFLADPARYAASDSFVMKIGLLCAAIFYQSQVFRKIVRKDTGVRPQALNVLVAVVSIGLWLGVSWAEQTVSSLPPR
jgi:hypothetical protein